MAIETNHCAWCGSPVTPEQQAATKAALCPECDETFETEGHRSLHPIGERVPHND
jgi:hypothetical protein